MRVYEVIMSMGNYINHATITRIVERLLGTLLIYIKRVSSMYDAIMHIGYLSPCRLFDVTREQKSNS